MNNLLISSFLGVVVFLGWPFCLKGVIVAENATVETSCGKFPTLCRTPMLAYSSNRSVTMPVQDEMLAEWPLISIFAPLGGRVVRASCSIRLSALMLVPESVFTTDVPLAQLFYTEPDAYAEFDRNHHDAKPRLNAHGGVTRQDEHRGKPDSTSRPVTPHRTRSEEFI